MIRPEHRENARPRKLSRTWAKCWIVRRAPGNDPHRGLLKVGARVYPCALGRAGISVVKREGDGATPTGRHAILGGYFRRDRLTLQSAFSGLHAISPSDGWCDDHHHPAYNNPVRLPFPASHERMFRDDRLYDVCLVLDWNFTRRARYRGSAIFMHVCRPGFGATEGCVALPRDELAVILERIDPAARVVIEDQST